ncbi:MAG: hypothetical protein GX625_16285 [Clostridiaceae bacterium]|nr:hypothetical protein [Clostridiaceae bacterium]
MAAVAPAPAGGRGKSQGRFPRKVGAGGTVHTYEDLLVHHAHPSSGMTGVRAAQKA